MSRTNSAESATKSANSNLFGRLTPHATCFVRRLGQHDLRRLIAWYSAPIMFALSLVFLVCQAILVVVWVDVPNLSENALVAIDPTNPNAEAIRRSLSQPIIDHRLQDTTIAVMLFLWPFVIAEAIWHWISRRWNVENRWFHFYSLLFCLCPSLRMCARSPDSLLNTS